MLSLQIQIHPNSKYKYRIGTFFQLNTTLSSKWQTESEQILLLHVSNLWCWFLLLTGGGGFGVLWQDKGELSKGRYLGQPADDEVVTLSLIFWTSCETKRPNYLGGWLSKSTVALSILNCKFGYVLKSCSQIEILCCTYIPLMTRPTHSPAVITPQCQPDRRSREQTDNQMISTTMSDLLRVVLQESESLEKKGW